jgi:ribosomal protein S18 acetylase RimI-like enzyme
MLQFFFFFAMVHLTSLFRGTVHAIRYNGYFVDLFVRASNIPAITMYQKVCQQRSYLNSRSVSYERTVVEEPNDRC